jgi:hypothetical protein
VLVWQHLQLVYVRVPKSGNSSIRGSIDGAINDRMSSSRIVGLSDGWTSFSFVRNPWSRLVSAYRQKVHEDYASKKMINGVYKGFLDAGIPVHKNMSFDAFCEVVCDIPDNRTDKHLRSQSSFVIRKGIPIVSFLGKVETMESDWKKLMDRVGLHFKLAHLNHTGHEHYSSYYSDTRLINLVGDRYAEDVRNFKYDFIQGIKAISTAESRHIPIRLKG